MKTKYSFVLLFGLFTPFLVLAMDTVWVARPDGGQSCNPKKAETLAHAAKALKKVGVRVSASKKDHDGQMHIQMCGADAGTLNTFEIRAQDWPKAKKLGYQKKEAPSLSSGK